jgi:hypothetical protein
MQIYLVRGTTGYYENTHTWTVKAYTDKAKAEFHARKAQPN